MMKVGVPNEAPLALVIELAEKGCPAFYSAFALVYPQFDEKLRATGPSLRPEDLAICAYTKLGFQTKQIAQFKKLSIRAVDSRKYRIRKILGIEKGVAFSEYILNF